MILFSYSSVIKQIITMRLNFEIVISGELELQVDGSNGGWSIVDEGSVAERCDSHLLEPTLSSALTAVPSSSAHTDTPFLFLSELPNDCAVRTRTPTSSGRKPSYILLTLDFSTYFNQINCDSSATIFFSSFKNKTVVLYIRFTGAELVSSSFSSALSV